MSTTSLRRPSFPRHPDFVRRVRWDAEPDSIRWLRLGSMSRDGTDGLSARAGGADHVDH